MAFLLESDREAVREFVSLLTAARGLSETEGSSWPGESTHYRKPSSKSPPRSTSVADAMVEDLRIRTAKHRIDVDHRRWRSPSRIPTFKEWARFVASRYDGVSVREAAMAEGCSPSLIQKAKQVAKQNGRIAA